jgi:hypothetical protein
VQYRIAGRKAFLKAGSIREFAGVTGNNELTLRQVGNGSDREEEISNGVVEGGTRNRDRVGIRRELKSSCSSSSHFLGSVTGSAAGELCEISTLIWEIWNGSRDMRRAPKGEDTRVVVEVRSSYAKPKDESCQL